MAISIIPFLPFLYSLTRLFFLSFNFIVLLHGCLMPVRLHLDVLGALFLQFPGLHLGDGFVDIFGGRHVNFDFGACISGWIGFFHHFVGVDGRIISNAR